MGSKGRLPGSTYGKPSRQGGRPPNPNRQKRPGKPKKAAEPAFLPIQRLDLAPPTPPEHLGPLAAEIWVAVHAYMPALQSELDSHTVQRYCELAEDLARAREAIERHGLLIEEPIVTPRGDIAGKRFVLNPAEAALRRADRALDGLADRLGLSPAARARLGVTISQTQLVRAQADRVISSMFQPAIDLEENQ